MKYIIYVVLLELVLGCSYKPKTPIEFGDSKYLKQGDTIEVTDGVGKRQKIEFKKFTDDSLIGSPKTYFKKDIYEIKTVDDVQVNPGNSKTTRVVLASSIIGTGIFLGGIASINIQSNIECGEKTVLEGSNCDSKPVFGFWISGGLLIIIETVMLLTK